MAAVNRIRRVVHRVGLVLVCSGILSTVRAGQATPVAVIKGWVGQNQGAGTDHAGSVVWVDDIPGEFPAPTAHAILDQKDMRFIPHILTILVGTTVDFPNSDPVFHNVFSISPLKRFNLGLYSKGHVPTIMFDKPGIISILCNVHPEMLAFIVVLKTPFFAVPGPDGDFIIRNIPSGSRTVRYWPEDGRTQERRVTLATGSVQMVDFRTEHGR